MNQPDDKSTPEQDAAPQTKLGAGSLLAAILLGFLGFLSLLSTGCFGLFAFAARRDRVDGGFFLGMLVMAAVTVGFILWSRALLKRIRQDNSILQASDKLAPFKEGSDQ